MTNGSDHTVGVPSYFDLRTGQESRRVETLMPHGEQLIGPGETIAFYCTMDEKQWNAAQQMTFYDSEGNHYSVDLGDSGI